MSKGGKSQSLSDRVVALIEAAKHKVGVAVNLAQVYTNYEMGRQIVEEEQKGRRRAGYGEKIGEVLSAKLTARFGRGWSVRSIETIRKLFLMYGEIPQTVSAELVQAGNSANGVCGIGESTSVSQRAHFPDVVNAGGRVPCFSSAVSICYFPSSERGSVKGLLI